MGHTTTRDVKEKRPTNCAGSQCDRKRQFSAISDVTRHRHVNFTLTHTHTHTHTHTYTHTHTHTHTPVCAMLQGVISSLGSATERRKDTVNYHYV
jgi:ABC-type nickel/cobalt efflux system permease component RcnA